MNFDIWGILGLEPTNDEGAIKRAYRAKLRVTNPEDDAAAFQRLREAYELAQQRARAGRLWIETEEPTPAPPDPADPEPPAGHAEPASRQPTPATRPVDPLTRAIETGLDELGRELLRDAPLDLARAQNLLDTLLDASHLERFDLLEILDERLGDLLARTSPRSDPLLSRVVEALQWSERSDREFLPPPAHHLLARHSYLSRWQQLETGTDDESQAWRRLAGAEDRVERWIRAFVRHHTSWPELDLLDSLDRLHPELLGQLNEANVAWWRRFAQRPRFSVLTLSLGLMVSMCAAIWASAEASRAGDRSVWLLTTLGFAGVFFAIELARVYLIEWPILIVRQHWDDDPPAWLRTGWVADAMVLPLLALWSRNIPWLAWTWVAFAVLTALLAAIAGGPTGPVAKRDGDFGAKNSRLLRLPTRCFWVGLWVVLLVLTFPGEFELPLLLTVTASICASAWGRDEQAVGFSAGLSLTLQRLAGWAVGLLTLTMMWLVISRGTIAEWQPAILVGTLACVIARYCFTLKLSEAQDAWNPILLWATVTALMMARAWLNSDGSSRPSLTDGPWYCWILALMLQVGALLAVLRFLWHHRGANRRNGV